MAFELLHFRSGSQTTSHHGQEYLIFSTAVPTGTSGPSFSLVPSLTLEKQFNRSDSSVVPMTGWTSLDDWSLWMHADPTNPSTTGVAAAVLAAASAIAERGDRLWIEYLNGRFVAYVRQTGRVEQATVERLIANGFDVRNRLG